MGRPKGCTKNPHDLSVADVMKSIANSNKTDLTKTQLTEAINVFSESIVELLLMDSCPEDIKIPIPKIGKLLFKKTKGLVVGDTYKTPVDFGKTKDENGKSLMQTITVTEDMPDRLRVWLEVSPTLQASIRETTEARWRRKHEWNKKQELRRNSDGK